MKTFLLSIFVTATIYHADPRQTDSTPFITASGAVINKENPQGHRWIAVSRDLLKKGFKFGTRVCVENAGHLSGYWYVQDVMNKRFTSRIDFLVNKSLNGGKWTNVKIKIE